jgi:DNA-binding transcriptional LysR family regulator
MNRRTDHDRARETRLANTGMDTELLKTFLEVERTGHFGNAAETLYLTPAAVSARIKQLEGTLGQPLFYRDRKRVSLTPAGERLKPYAENILDTWRRALRESPLGNPDEDRLSLGSTPNLWDSLLQNYLLELHREYPHLHLFASCHDSGFLISQLQNGLLDLTVQLEPVKMQGIGREKVGDIDLVLVSTERLSGPEELASAPYVQVDWSSHFTMEHQRMPAADTRRPTLFASTGKIGLGFLLASGGSMYLPEFMARDLLEASRLHPVPGAEAITQPFYVNFREDSLGRALIPRLIGMLIEDFRSLKGG